VAHKVLWALPHSPIFPDSPRGFEADVFSAWMHFLSPTSSFEFWKDRPLLPWWQNFGTFNTKLTTTRLI